MLCFETALDSDFPFTKLKEFHYEGTVIHIQLFSKTVKYGRT